MDLASELSALSLSSAFSTDRDFEGFAIDSDDELFQDGTSLVQFTPQSSTSDSGTDLERFFEICFDAGITVVPEDEFQKGSFLGAGTTMSVYEGEWKSEARLVAMK